MSAASSPFPAPRIGVWLGEGITLFQLGWQTWLSQGLLYLLMVGGPIGLGVIAYYAALIPLFMGGTRGGQPPSFLLGAVGGMYGAMLLSGLLHCYLLPGMIRTAIRQLRGESISVRDLFSGGRYFLRFLGLQLLLVFFSQLGVLCLCVGWIVALALTSHAGVLLVERRVGVWEALRVSASVTLPHFWPYTLWGLFFGLMGQVAGSCCYVGWALSIPYTVLCAVVAFRDTFGIPGALPVSAPVSRVASRAMETADAVRPGGTAPPSAPDRGSGQLAAASDETFPAPASDAPGHFHKVGMGLEPQSRVMIGTPVSAESRPLKGSATATAGARAITAAQTSVVIGVRPGPPPAPVSPPLRTA